MVLAICEQLLAVVLKILPGYVAVLEEFLFHKEVEEELFDRILLREEVYLKQRFVFAFFSQRKHGPNVCFMIGVRKSDRIPFLFKTV